MELVNRKQEVGNRKWEGSILDLVTISWYPW